MPTQHSWFKLFVCVVFFIGLNQKLIAQSCTHTISGIVTDEHNFEPISDVYIVMSQQPSKVYFTDSKGKYSIPNVCLDSVTLVFNHIGCESLTRRFLLNKQTHHIDVQLEHHAEELKQFVITQSKHQEILQQLSQMNQIDLLKGIGLSLGDQLTTLNGVDKLSSGAGVAKPVIQGQHSNRLVMINHGVRQEGQQWGSDHAPSISALDNGGVTVLKGASSVRYGANAIGGVIIMEPNAIPSEPGIAGKSGVGYHSNGRLFQGATTIQHRFKKWNRLGYELSTSYKQNGTTKTPEYYLANTSANETYVAGQVNWLGEHYEVTYRHSVMENNTSIFSGAHIGNLNDLQRAFNQEQPTEITDFTYQISRPKQYVYHEFNQITQKIKTHQLGVFEINLSRQYNLREEFDRMERGNGEQPELHLELTTLQGELLWRHPEKFGLHGIFGMTGLTQDNTYEGRDFIPNYAHKNLGLFWIEHKEFNSWRLEAGLRFEQDFLDVYRVVDASIENPTYQYQQWSFNAGISKKINEYWLAHVRIANAWRPPHVNELFSSGVHHGSAAIENGNNQLTKEQTLGVYGGVSFRKNKWIWITDAYVNNSNNYIYLQANQTPVLTIRGAFPSFDYQQTKARITGIESTLTYAWNEHHQTNVSLNYIRGIDLKNELGMVGIPANRIHWKHQVSGNINPKITYEIALGATLVDKQRLVKNEQDYVPIPSGYVLFNTHAALILKKNHHVGFRVSNALNTTYRDYMNRFRYYSDELGRNIQLFYNIQF